MATAHTAVRPDGNTAGRLPDGTAARFNATADDCECCDEEETPCTTCPASGEGCCRHLEVIVTGTDSHNGTFYYDLWDTMGLPTGSIVEGLATCGAYGPGGTTGWLITFSVCGADNTPSGNTATWEVFIPTVEYGTFCCAQLGAATVECIQELIDPTRIDCMGIEITVTVLAGPYLLSPEPCDTTTYCAEFPGEGNCT